MKHSVIIILAMLFSFGFSQVSAKDITLDPTLPDYVHEGNKWPPVLFISSIEENDFKNYFASYEAFEELDEEAPGSPIAITAYKHKRMKSNAGSFSSLMVSASTLGLVPVVSNKAFNVYYNVYIQGKKVNSYTFEMTSTEVDNFWSMNANADIKPQEQVFLEKTVSQLYHELSQDEELQSHFAEYDLYFR